MIQTSCRPKTPLVSLEVLVAVRFRRSWPCRTRAYLGFRDGNLAHPFWEGVSSAPGVFRRQRRSRGSIFFWLQTTFMTRWSTSRLSGTVMCIKGCLSHQQSALKLCYLVELWIMEQAKDSTSDLSRSIWKDFGFPIVFYRHSLWWIHLGTTRPLEFQDHTIWHFDFGGGFLFLEYWLAYI